MCVAPRSIKPLRVSPNPLTDFIPLYYLFLVHIYEFHLRFALLCLHLMVNDFLLLSPMLCWCWHCRPLLMDLSGLLLIQYTYDMNLMNKFYLNCLCACLPVIFWFLCICIGFYVLDFLCSWIVALHYAFVYA